MRNFTNRLLSFFWAVAAFSAAHANPSAHAGRPSPPPHREIVAAAAHEPPLPELIAGFLAIGVALLRRTGSGGNSQR